MCAHVLATVVECFGKKHTHTQKQSVPFSPCDIKNMGTNSFFFLLVLNGRVEPANTEQLNKA